jgi:hypothetical protein
MRIMRSTRAATAALPCSGLWASYVRAMMDTDHRLVLRWCAHLEFEDVLRIDRGSIHAALSDPARSLGAWRIVLGNGRFPQVIVPVGLVLTTHRYAMERSLLCAGRTPHDVLVFSDSYGEAITRASLVRSIHRAMTLVRLSDAFLSGQVAKP